MLITWQCCWGQGSYRVFLEMTAFFCFRNDWLICLQKVHYSRTGASRTPAKCTSLARELRFERLENLLSQKVHHSHWSPAHSREVHQSCTGALFRIGSKTSPHNKMFHSRTGAPPTPAKRTTLKEARKPFLTKKAPFSHGSLAHFCEVHQSRTAAPFRKGSKTSPTKSAPLSHGSPRTPAKCTILARELHF